VTRETPSSSSHTFTDDDFRGRIGRIVYRIKYHYMHGWIKGTIEAKNCKLIVNGNPVTIFGERDPAAIPWSWASAEYIVKSAVRPFLFWFSRSMLIAVFCLCRMFSRLLATIYIM
jgi:hypothetical protein